MKKLFTSIIAISFYSVIFSLSLQAKPVYPVSTKADTTIDPKKNPGPVNLDKHPELITNAITGIKNGKIAYQTKSSITDTAIDVGKHPEIVKAIIKDPSHWAAILKVDKNSNDTLTVEGRNKQVIRDIIADLKKENIIKERSDIDSFLLTDSEFMINGKKADPSLFNKLSKKYIKAPGYKIYYGPEDMKGVGIFQKSDTL
ncbi:hypothetical protein [Mucilaginibacter sp. OK098]|uniref:hypothetical protein n=1 Tax=Mucilaginibacter sp. OK098 TaxID=1855297 RepID=UPI000920EDFD|nr:hypothetical protein [Mucilaginibacter sp. OK098]SHN36427.1 hypothetical protein SAMN05216524_11356 [Mucilaginibacter sp. OK098]